MRVWWCEEHESVSNADQSLGEGAVRMCHAAIAWDDDALCREVEMQLLPLDARVVGADALVIEKVDGEWPLAAAKAIYDCLAPDHDNERDRLYLAALKSTVILDALALAFNDTETP